MTYSSSTATSQPNVSSLNGSARRAAECHHDVHETIIDALDILWDAFEEDQPSNLYQLVMGQVERPLLARVLERCDHNQSRAAACLGINRSTLRKKLRDHDLI
ncbi:helix-turn-helix domain-containing protein [Guyparkeria halophila]|uniref:Helix-turn-helix domain-containing protein n=1 Tax=Guyparkeria halophila TaxID=47960 RepID=A0ABZ0YSZ2_9GAMM|nr:helix-turn-helix domain-containing protein [Guyparkeria halophila]WQH15283.1 helix-turn-helix domain-containing protein [Guyparkeria halophila]